MDLEADIQLQVGDNNTVLLVFQNLSITNFTVTKDNCGAASDAHNIQTRLNSIMLGVEAGVNAFIQGLKPQLPQFNTFDYKVHFDY